MHENLEFARLTDDPYCMAAKLGLYVNEMKAKSGQQK